MIADSAARHADAMALKLGGATATYGAFADTMQQFGNALVAGGLARGDRVAVYAEKRLETIAAMAGASAAGGAFVPVNPLLKPAQVAHILNDCDVRFLVTTASRLESLAGVMADCPTLHLIVLIGDAPNCPDIPVATVSWQEFISGDGRPGHAVIDHDMTAILYTSGSTGMPKGVVLSHRNLVVGAQSVASYLENTGEDRILSVLPLSFDAGLSQISTAFSVGARVVLLNYLLPRDVVKAVAAEGITGLAGVPPLWNQLAGLDWPTEAASSLRYFTNTGGAMPLATLARLRAALPDSQPYLMYGLTEAFRSTYLPPSEIDRRPDSIGKAIPNAEILVVREDGGICGPGEEGELVHRGALVSLGYWNDPERTAERFRPAPGGISGLVNPELAVWSGDTVRMDEDGFLYFVGRRDEMIKTSGYRVSPTEVEEVLHSSGAVGEVAVLGIAHPELGQAIIAIVTPPATGTVDEDKALQHCRAELPGYMVPHRLISRDALPRNPNGKFDRSGLAAEYAGMYAGEAE